mmetsp:Transcript_4065/g.9493  ORF Transcript_4065/g.9493 Transcript_4065/m.9493 type:complete len:323 (-) Transcript_4065:57-1025(-)
MTLRVAQFPLATLGLGLTAATAAGLFVNWLLEACIGKSEEELDGFPRSRWLLSVAIQALVFPSLAWLSVSAARWSGLDFGQWLAAGSKELPDVSQWYIFALFGSQSRDMCPMPAATSFLMKVHHYVVTVACVLCLLAPKGMGLFVAGTFILELGSMFYNLRVLYPGCKMAEVLYQVTMPTSNILALAGGLLLLHMQDVPLWMKVLYFVADVGVCIGRQRHALKDAGLIGSAKVATSSDTAQRGVASAAAGTKYHQKQQHKKLDKQGRGRWLVGGLMLSPLIAARPLRRLEPKLRALPGGARQLLHLRPNGRRVPAPRLALWR